MNEKNVLLYKTRILKGRLVVKSVILLIILLSMSAFAEFTRELTINIYHDDFDKILSFFKSIEEKGDCSIGKFKYNKIDEDLTITLFMSKDKYYKVSSDIEELGIPYKKEINIKSDSSLVKKMQVNLEIGKELVKQYKEYIANNMDKSSNIEGVLLKSKSEQLQLVKYEDALKKELKWLNTYSIKAHFSPKVLQNFERGYFQFINMPGVEFNTIVVENEKKGKSAKVYFGGGLKWMLTRRNTHIRAGILKSTTDNKDEMSDVFYLGIGHAFFPRYIGRKNKKAFNPYTSFDYGGAILRSSNEDVLKFVTLTPKIGFELLRTSKILLDISAGYFLPLSIKHNYDFRGFSSSVNFNFVF